MMNFINTKKMNESLNLRNASIKNIQNYCKKYNENFDEVYNYLFEEADKYNVKLPTKFYLSFYNLTKELEK